MRLLSPLMAIMLSASEVVYAQTDDWEQSLEDISTDDEFDEGAWESNYDFLSEMQSDPININTAKEDDLLRLPFLTEKQVEDIGYYIYKYGEMRSPSDLLLTGSVDYETLQLLLPFIYFGEIPEDKSGSSSLISDKRWNELTAYANIPTYTRRGDKSGYLGGRYKHWLKYNMIMGEKVKIGISASQDAGEPFFTGRNKWGYDFYSGYLMIEDVGKVDALCLGTFRLSCGLGLVANSGFSIGKSSALQTMGRQASGLRGYSSRSEGKYFRGMASSLNLSETAKLTGFVSYRKMDATLNSDSTAATLLYTGYHRTQTEMAKKHNTGITSFGLDLIKELGDFSFGATAIYSHLGRKLVPDSTSLYKRYYAKGSDFLNMGINYSYISSLLAIRGETAINKNGNLATINMASLHLSNSLNLMLIQRFYSYKYTSLYSSSFSEGSSTQNESGIYLGLKWKANQNLSLNFYADYAHFPFAKYQVSSPSDAFDSMISASFNKGNWTVKGRYRLHIKQKDYTDDDGNTSLTDRYEHKARLSAKWEGDGLSATIQADASVIDIKYPPEADADGLSKGFMYGIILGWKHGSGPRGKLSVSLSGKYFHTDDYNSRLYAYEGGMAYTYSSSSYYGHGIRYSANVRWDLPGKLMLCAKVGTTDYFDRTSIGSGYQVIDGSSKCDIELQAKIIISHGR